MMYGTLFLILYLQIFMSATIQYAHSASLSWNVSATTKMKNIEDRMILLYATGQASQGKLHAIIGPSGCGKTTLLNILAGIVPKRSLNIYGNLSYSTDYTPTSVFVQQEDLLFAQLTVQETLETSSSLKSSFMNPSKTIGNVIKSMVEKSILQLGLKKSANTVVGNAKTRGISGGEKKRLSIGNELISLDVSASGSDLVIFADEPTSGLDSYQALKVVEILRNLASKDGYTVITSIHQPRASIFELFDEITLMSEGQVIYSGETKHLLDYFTAIGYACPQYVNPAEYYLDLIAVDYSSPEQEQASRHRIQLFANAYNKKTTYTPLLHTTQQSKKAPSDAVIIGEGGVINNIRSVGRQFRILFQRAFRQVVRDKPTNIARLMSGLFSALLFGSIYYKMGLGASTVADRLGLLQVTAVNTAMTALIKATTSFVTEKLIVQRERKGNWYKVEPYFISKLLAETPLSAFFPMLSGAIMYHLCGLNPLPGRLLKFLGILVVESMAATALGMSVGSLATSVESAIAVAPAVMVIFIVFGGLYVVNAPSYLKWVPQISLIRWAYEALCVNEFIDLKLQPAADTGPLSVSDGKQVLDSLGYGSSTVKHAIIAQLGIVAANYLFTYLSIKLQKPSFERLSPNPITRNNNRTNERQVIAIPVAMEDVDKPSGGSTLSSSASSSHKSPQPAQVVRGRAI